LDDHQRCCFVIQFAEAAENRDAAVSALRGRGQLARRRHPFAAGNGQPREKSAVQNGAQWAAPLPRTTSCGLQITSSRNDGRW
jgi:hypothetical protein